MGNVVAKNAILIVLVLACFPCTARANYLEDIESNLRQSFDVYQGLADADRAFFDELWAARRAADLQAEYHATATLATRTAYDEQVQTYFLVRKAELELALHRPHEAYDTINYLLETRSGDPGITLPLDLHLARWFSVADEESAFAPTFAQTEQQYEKVFSKYDPYDAGVLQAHIEFGRKALEVAQNDPSMIQYAEIGVQHIEQALQFIAALAENPSLAQHPPSERVIIRLRAMAERDLERVKQWREDIYRTAEMMSEQEASGSRPPNVPPPTRPPTPPLPDPDVSKVAMAQASTPGTGIRAADSRKAAAPVPVAALPDSSTPPDTWMRLGILILGLTAVCVFFAYMVWVRKANE